MTQLSNDLRSYALCALLQGRPNFFMDDTKSQYPKPDNHIKGTSEHTKRMDLMICLGKKPNPTREVPYETIIRGFRSAWQQQFDGNH
jgi:hypothetical protein